MNYILNSALGFLFILVVLITLKLTNYINWSWWWVTSPAWVVLGIAAFIFFILSSLHF